MNQKHLQKVKNVAGRPGVAVLLFVLIVVVGTIQHYNSLDNQPNTTTINTVDNQSIHQLDNNTCQKLNGTVVYENVSENQSIQDVYCRIS